MGIDASEMFDIECAAQRRVLNVSAMRVAGVRTVMRASHVKTCEMKAARLPKGFAAFYLPAITACLN